jgi:hypothetical protein
MGWTLRTGRLSDAGAVLLLWAEADAEPTRTDDVASLQRLIVHDPAALIVAEEDGRLVGSVIAGWDGWRGSVYRLVVAPPIAAADWDAGCWPRPNRGLPPLAQSAIRPSSSRPNPWRWASGAQPAGSSSSTACAS